MHGEDLYRRLATGEAFVILDVRTETEYERQHIPGSLLVPLQELETRWKEVPTNGTPVAVVCEFGLRSAAACQFLAEHGIERLFNVEDGLIGWPGPVEHGPEPRPLPHLISPERFLIDSFHLLPKGLALDIAMGEGRNAIYLASRGFDVDGVDVDAEAVSRARIPARRLGAPIRAVVGNVEDGTYIIPIETYDVILVFNFLHRPLLTDIREGLRPGGVVIYQSYTSGQQSLGPVESPSRLLFPGELKKTFDDWEVLRYLEGVDRQHPGGPARAVAGIVARKPE
jgi:rhodanese-related sulfurtransferase